MSFRQQIDDLDRKVWRASVKKVSPGEDGFVQNASANRARKVHGNFLVNILCPLYHSYRYIKHLKNDAHLPLKYKIIMGTTSVVFDAAVTAGEIYLGIVAYNIMTR